MKARLLRTLACTVLAAAAARGATPAARPAVTVDWDHVLRPSVTTLSFQVVVNPFLRRGAVLHGPAFAAIAELRADAVRFVPWLPYPRLAVAELEAPTAGRTSWDFSLLDPLVEDFMQASGDRPVMMDFSTIPAWLFATPAPVAYPADPDEVTWTYTQGTELRPGGLQELADYYARVAGWYLAGGFVDELGRRHESGHRYRFAYWEVCNEPDLEHKMTPRQYTERYDAIVAAVRRVAPDLKFVGLSLALPSQAPEMFEHFLNPANHAPGIPLDMISYHFYALVDRSQTAEHWQHTFFDQADRFVATARYIDVIRRRWSPATQVALNEVGTILPADRESKSADPATLPPIPPEYWNASGAVFAYLFAESAKLGIEVISMSQLVGFPTQYPSVTMIDWRTGAPTARYRVLQLLRQHFQPGDRLVVTRTEEMYPDTLVQGFVTPHGRKLLLVNKRNRPVTVRLHDPVAAGTLEAVDVASGPGPARRSGFAGADVALGPFAVAVLTFSPPSS
ncbi:MAG: glycosyl hydrolase family 39 [Verrucomicrobia bacterium]|nr:glycosyl hydrolase family 39 [Verrucomicrobiota bacterium]